jgi:GT2 family glycosyltransferase
MEYSRRCRIPAIRLLENPDRVTPVAFNIGIAAATGDVIFTLGAHTRYSSNYVSRAVATMIQWSADAVGSVAVTEPGAKTRFARAIALALSSRFGVGGSHMRVGVAAPREADTASCPGYRRSVFERVGLFNPRLIRNQDIDLNLRLRRAGGTIVVDPGIRSLYRARARLGDLARNSFENGYWVVRSLRFSRMPFALRHVVPLGFLSALILPLAFCLLPSAFIPLPSSFRLLPLASAVVAGLYLAADVWFSLRATTGRFDSRLALLAVFPVLHLSYGLGSLWALATLWIPPASVHSRLRIRQSSSSERNPTAVADEH